jgi:SAM-dependent methyltransferase
MAAFKAEVLNRFVRDNSVQSVIEFGCGDGNQLRLADYPRYIGYDVSIDVVETCRAIFREDPTKRFDLLKDYDGNQADLTLSLDVVYHLVEDEVFEDHMKQIFDATTRIVAVYSSDTDDNSAAILSHIRHRKFTTWVSANRPDWLLLERILNKYPYNGDHRSSSFADFHFFARQ